MTGPLRLVSMMADNSAFLYRGLAAYLRERTGADLHIVEIPPWQERQQQLEEGAAHVGFLCGLTYVRWAERGTPPVELLAAAVPCGERYQGRPVYFSDVVVRRDSAARSFADLRGSTWAYNEPDSHSGYNVVRDHLARLQETEGYFGAAVEAGSHQRALRTVLAGEMDAAAIDSTVLELEVRRHPELAAELRIVETLGPSPIPPGIIATTVAPNVRAALRDGLLAMHHDAEGAELLRTAGIARYVPVTDADYDPIRQMAQRAARARPGPLVAPAPRSQLL